MGFNMPLDNLTVKDSYLSLLQDYVIIFLVIMEIKPLCKEWGDPLFTLWYIGNESVGGYVL